MYAKVLNKYFSYMRAHIRFITRMRHINTNRTAFTNSVPGKTNTAK